MSVTVVAGAISKLAISDAGVSMHLDDKDDTLMLSTRHSNYNALVSAAYVAASNGFRVDVKTDLDGRTVETLQVYPEG